MTTFENLRSANVTRQQEWDPDDRITLAYRGNELGGECGEAQNIIKKIERERLGIRGSRATIEDLADELADLIICADLIAMQENFDLGAAVARKFNATSEKYNLETRMSIGDHTVQGLIEKAKGLGLDGEPMASWVIGELMLLDPWMRMDAAVNRYQQATGGR